MVGAERRCSPQGHVVVRQGDRTIKANQVQYDRNNNSLRTQGGIDYTDPLVHVTGSGGSYSPTAGADFESAQFSLLQRSARGAAQEMQLTPAGPHLSGGRDLHDLPGERPVLGPARGPHHARYPQAGGHADATRASTSRACRSSICPGCRFRSATSARAAFCSRPSATPPAAAWSSRFPTTGTSRPTSISRFEPTEYSRRGTDLGGDFRYLDADDSTASSTGTICRTMPCTMRSRSRVRLATSPSCPMTSG